MSFIWPQEMFIFNIVYPVALIRPSFVFSKGKISNFYLTSGFQLVVFYFVFVLFVLYYLFLVSCILFYFGFESFGVIRVFFSYKAWLTSHCRGYRQTKCYGVSGIRIFVLEMSFQIYVQVCQGKLILKKISTCQVWQYLLLIPVLGDRLISVSLRAAPDLHNKFLSIQGYTVRSYLKMKSGNGTHLYSEHSGGRGRQVYRACSRIAKATHRSPISKKKGYFTNSVTLSICIFIIYQMIYHIIHDTFLMYILLIVARK